jgi:hypothetical protein
LRDEIDDRQAAPIKALPLGEIEEPVQRPVEAIEMQDRADRDALRSLPLIGRLAS